MRGFLNRELSPTYTTHTAFAKKRRSLANLTNHTVANIFSTPDWLKTCSPMRRIRLPFLGGTLKAKL